LAAVRIASNSVNADGPGSTRTAAPSDMGREIPCDMARDIFSVFGSVVPFSFQRVEILFRDISGDINSIEDGRIKVREPR
jgi:hypothetical protein